MKLSLPSSAMAIPGGTGFSSPTNALAGDARSLDALRSTAARNPKAAVKDAAKQFEALFMQELMKSMRQASMASGLLDNEGSKMGTEMLDQQFATQMTGMPGGLAAAIARQLERQMGGATLEATPPTAQKAARAHAATPDDLARVAQAAGTGTRQADFVAQHSDAARAAESATGIPANFMVAQAAHESGWGRREIKNADGSTSFNVFGIKAGSSWTGKTAEVTTTEYIRGKAQKVVAKFRAYDSYESAFKDYAQLMKNSPRYSQVLAKADTAHGFAHGLQKAGYATDPAYADKLTRVINTTLRLQRVMA
jgi:flagellar protein FlgJ